MPPPHKNGFLLCPPKDVRNIHLRSPIVPQTTDHVESRLGSQTPGSIMELLKSIQHGFAMLCVGNLIIREKTLLSREFCPRVSPLLGLKNLISLLFMIFYNYFGLKTFRN